MLAGADAYLIRGKTVINFLHHYKVNSDRIFIVPMTHDKFIHKSLYLEQEEIRRKFDLNKFIFLYVGRIVEKKGVRDLVDAYINLVSKKE